MAAGRPAVLAIDGVIRKVMDVAKGGIFVPPGQDKALAEAVVYLADHRDEALDMGKAARAYVEGHFDRALQAATFVEMVVRLGSKEAGKRF